MDIERGVAFEVNRCRCCGRPIKEDYLFCIGCDRKRMKIFNDCIGSGMSVFDARAKVDGIYPQYFL